jgi:hypothetical protein
VALLAAWRVLVLTALAARGSGSGTLLPPWKRSPLDLSATGLPLACPHDAPLPVGTFEVEVRRPTSSRQRALDSPNSRSILSDLRFHRLRPRFRWLSSGGVVFGPAASVTASASAALIRGKIDAARAHGLDSLFSGDDFALPRDGIAPGGGACRWFGLH